MLKRAVYTVWYAILCVSGSWLSGLTICHSELMVVVRRTAYNAYDGRDTCYTTVAVRCVLRPPSYQYSFIKERAKVRKYFAIMAESVVVTVFYGKRVKREV